MSFKKAALVINPRTGQNVTKLPAVLAVLAAAGWKTGIALKEYGGHSMVLAEQASKDNSDLVIAYGGDGTLNQIVNGVLHNKKAHSTIGVIPGGTANLWAGDIGVPSDPVQAALSLLNSEVRKVDVGHIEVQDISFPEETGTEQPKASKKNAKKASRSSSGGTRDNFLLMAGLGFDAAVMNNVSKPLKYRIGALAVGLAAAKNLPEQHAFPIAIEAKGKGKEDDLYWEGEALQVIIGNTRRYAIVLEPTPNAYIDDGVLDVCVITAGDPLTTMQQVSSMLLRHKLDNTTTENFKGARLCIKVPATVPLEVDGSTVLLKDFLSKADYKRLQQVSDPRQVMVTYCFEAMPHALGVTIPRTYDQSLFEHNGKHHEQQEEQPETAVKHKDEEIPQTALQQRTAQEESQPQHPIDEKQRKHRDEVRQELPELAGALLENGRKVTVLGKTPFVDHPGMYVIAGETQKASTGDPQPVAVILDKETRLFNREGNHITIDAAQDLHNGSVIVVEGNKSKRGVIHAARAVL